MKHISPRPQPAAGNPKKPHPRAGEVRIIGGRFKRSKLTVPVASGLRPTGDRVRETLFNWLGQDLSGLRCFDAFAGSGALGFEAASRGAETVWMVERDRAALQALTQNQARLNVPGVRIVSGDAIALLSAQRSAGWDVVFLDPPVRRQNDRIKRKPALPAGAAGGAWCDCRRGAGLPRIGASLAGVGAGATGLSNPSRR